MILEKFIMFEKNVFEKLISETHGKIDSIFECQRQNNSLYIIKTKILRNLIDNGQLLNNTKYLINIPVTDISHFTHFYYIKRLILKSSYFAHSHISLFFGLIILSYATIANIAIDKATHTTINFNNKLVSLHFFLFFFILVSLI